jgi:hypothetical protein
MIESVTLENMAVRLEPLTRDHASALANAAADGELWNLGYTSVPKPDSMMSLIEKALAAQAAGHELPFVIRLQESGSVVGSTRYLKLLRNISAWRSDRHGLRNPGRAPWSTRPRSCCS